MSKRLIFEVDGIAHVFMPAPKARGMVEIAPGSWREETDEELFARAVEIAKRHGGIPADAATHELDVDELPSGEVAKAFRNAWRIDRGRVSIDMAKARAAHMDRIRAARAPGLQRLDLDTMRAMERGDHAAMPEIAAKKQRLRDLPQAFDLTIARSPEELHMLWPADLPRV